MKILEAATVFHVNDVTLSIRWFKDVLGFTELFCFGEYAGIKRDGCIIHLTSMNNNDACPPGHGVIYIVCDEVDMFHATVAATDATILWTPRDQPYRLRDFGVNDPSGNKLYFGCALRSDNS